MTERQLKAFYFPLWNECAHVNDWIMVRGKLLGTRLEKFGPAEVDRIYQAVWDAAEKLAQAEHRAVTATDLRHACTVVAVGKQLSSKELSNKQLDRVAALFRVLIEPDGIDAMLAWLNPEKDERKRLVYMIGKLAPFAYIDTLCKARSDFNYSSPFWEDLDIDHLKQLHMTLRNRAQNSPALARQQPAPAFVDVSRNNVAPEADAEAEAAPELTEDNVPF